MIAALRDEFYYPLVVLGRQISHSGSRRLTMSASFLTASGFKFLMAQHSTDNEPTSNKEKA
jgi:hypothetical protein